ncbi:class I SAM-dependent RNA methyltransferase [Mariprofundus sp. NF]|uniref:class I SAM-dependent RNA methyltransferase n=1 Tax=Mariprofundus sp. NF TaxID=2608716 RepID=UPI0015A011F4|nr:methyltransferase [Mariprofundus sp. NF]NWF38587.1 class I SAM-dependent RNA methyltransferase [Mariprofundus sp. NF]
MIGKTLKGRAGPILPGGEALVHADGDTVLVANAVPGDELAVHISGKRRGVWRGEIVEVLEASDQRITPACPVATLCGGCALQSISGSDQAKLKSEWVKSAFAPFIKSDTAWLPIVWQEDRFRRRVRWSVGSDRAGLFLGFKAFASHQPVRHRDCLVVTPQLNQLARLIEKNMHLNGVASVQALQLNDGIHLIIETEHPPESIATDELDALVLQWWWRDAQGITRPLKKPVIPLHDQLPAGNLDVAVTVGPDGFVQGQVEGNRELIAQIQDWAGKPRRIADLFCGIGNLSLPLAAASGAEVFGAELNAASVRAAAANAKALHVKASFTEANLFEDFDIEPYIGADLLLLDPPRRGAKRICDQISRLLPEKIIMISCDVAAGARDGAILKKHGYQFKALRALDLFPGAGHVEAMSLWTRI